jgi:hypothetical protein
MPKPNRLSNLSHLRDYVRKHGLNTVQNNIKISMKKDELQDRLKAVGHWDNQYDHSATEIRGSRAATSRDYKKRGELIKGPKKRPKLPHRDPKDLARAKLKAGIKGRDPRPRVAPPVMRGPQVARSQLVHGGAHGVYNPERDHRLQVRGLYK